jgi:hypothetical protein
MLYLHIPARHPPSFPELELPTLMQVCVPIYPNITPVNLFGSAILVADIDNHYEVFLPHHAEHCHCLIYTPVSSIGFLVVNA